MTTEPTLIQRRTILKGMGLAASAALLGACGSSRAGAVGGRPTVRVKTWTSLGYPSPFLYVGNPGYWRMSLLFDTLMWPDSTGKQLPWLAAKPPTVSEDGLVYTLELRDVSFSDGQPVKASDVKFTYEYYQSHTWTPLLIGVPRPGIDVRPVNDKTVQFRLDRPDAVFEQQVLGSMPIAPEHIFSKISDPMGTTDARVLTGTGAYKLEARSVDQDHEAYVANDKFFLGRPFVRRIEMLPVGNDDDDLAGIKAGLIDAGTSFAEGIRNEVVRPFLDDPQYGVVTREAAFGFPLYFNLAKGAALADVRFRRACLQAIDRNDLVTRLLTGNGTVGSAGWLPPTNPFHEPDVPKYPFDRAEAERQLDEAGYRRKNGGNRTQLDGSPLHYVLQIPDTVNVALAELVAANLKAVGIDVNLQRIGLIATFGTKLASSYDMIITSYPGPAPVGPEMDPDLLRAVYHSKSAKGLVSASGYNNPEVDRMLDAQVATYDQAERRRLVSQIQKKVAEDLPVAMLYYTKWYFVYRKSVFDQWYFTPGGFALGAPDIYNKQAYIMGRKEGLDIRQP